MGDPAHYISWMHLHQAVKEGEQPVLGTCPVQLPLLVCTFEQLYT
jgi:hypothetical protein